jgi:tryptophanyl-tRNA synthetase
MYESFFSLLLTAMLTLRQLGNYFGALANWVKLQSTAVPGDKLFFSVVGWHALTLPQDPKLLSEARTTMVALILASGIDPQRSIVFHQDEVTDSHRAVSRDFH